MNFGPHCLVTLSGSMPREAERGRREGGKEGKGDGRKSDSLMSGILCTNVLQQSLTFFVFRIHKFIQKFKSYMYKGKDKHKKS